MTDKRKQQLSFDSALYPASDVPAMVAMVAPVTKKPKRARTTPGNKPLPDTVQPFLPGLSRRGRPRLPNPVPAGVRASESRKRRLAAGGRRVELVLETEAARALDALVEHFKLTRAEIIARLLTKAAKRLPRP